MNDGNSFNDYVKDDDKCPNCGAIKMFSALVCPSCGMSYSESASMKKTADANKEINKGGTMSGFDPNASFAKYKNSLEHKEDETAEGSKSESEEKLTPLSEIEELDKPVELDPIAKKLQELTKQNSGMMGERTYRLDSNSSSEPNKNDNSTSSDKVSSGNASYGGLTGGNTFSAVNYSNPGASSSFSSQTGGARSGGGAAWTVGAKPNPGSGSFVGGIPQFGDDVSNRYDEYKAYSGGSSDGYSSPYSRGAFDVVPEKKKSVAAKIFPLALVLILLAVVGYGCYKYFNSDKNENGVSYEKGQSANGYYTNNWAGIKFKLSDGFQDYAFLAQSDVQKVQQSLSSQLKDKDVEIDLNLYAVQEVSEKGTKVPFPAAVIFTLSENDFSSKLFGADLDELFNDGSIGSAMLPGGGSVKMEKYDLLLGGHTYKGYRMGIAANDGSKLTMYICGRVIGNKIIIVYIYDVPGYTDVNFIKKHFENL